MIGRRDFITLLGGAAAAWPLTARAQQPDRAHRIGVLIASATADDPDGQARFTAFVQALQQLGWTEGRNVRIDIRWGMGDAERIYKYAAELVALTPDVILASGTPTVAPLLQATRTVPIVFAQVTDPVGAGFVDSLARPGGNATGFILFEYGISGKWLELLKEIAPGVTRAAVIRDATLSSGTGQFGAIQSVAPSVGVEVSPVNVRDAPEIERAVTAFARSSNGGLIVTASALAVVHRDLIITLAARHKLPAIYYRRLYVTDGGLISYGPDTADQHRRAAGYVDRILKGEKPADLPVQAPTKYELVINLKTAKALGLDVPPTLRARRRGDRMMRRRAFITLLGGAAAWPLAARAQQPAMPVIGFLNGASPESYADRVRAFREGLSETGYVEGRNIVIEFRWARGEYHRLSELVADLVRREVAVIVTNGPSAPAAKAATNAIPIVFVIAGDPIARGLVASLNHPGGNLTGVTNLNLELGPKRLELLHELLPTATKIAILVNPTNPNAETLSKDLGAAARSLGLEVYVLHATAERDFQPVFATLAQLQASGLVIATDPFFNGQSKQLASAAVRHMVPTIYQFREFATAGGLMSYGGSGTNGFRQAGVYSGRILKGEKPADLPVQQETKAGLVINLKTAKALGLEVPPTLLARADEVIE